MNDKDSVREFFNQIKKIVDNYMRNRKPTAVLLGVYTGSAIMIETLPIPMNMVSGNMVNRLVSGDRVRLLRNDGGHEYYLLEIIGKPYQIGGEGL